MFLALRDIRAARGRFTLITLTVAMLALLVSFLFGLTGGLRYQNVAAFSTLGGSYAYLSNDNLDRSELTLDDTKSLVDASPTATAVGITRVVLNEEPLAVLAVRPAASGPADDSTPLPESGHVYASSGAAEALGVSAGDTITIKGEELIVDGITGDDWYSHQKVLWTRLPNDQPANVVFTGSAITPDNPKVVQIATKDMPQALTAFKAQSMSLMLINIMLFIVTALVTGAFFTVWMMQRKPDIATLKALGASSSALIIDALGQAAMILGLGIVLGISITLVAAHSIGDSLPFSISPGSILLPARPPCSPPLGAAAAALGFLRSASALSALGENR